MTAGWGGKRAQPCPVPANEPGWACGAWQPDPPEGHLPYRCSLPVGPHADGRHLAELDGEVIVSWPARPDVPVPSRFFLGGHV